MTPREFLSQFSLNQITETRTSLTFEEAIAVWVMHWSGVINSVIAAKFGTNQGRVADILTEKKHVDSRSRAFEIFSS